MQRHGQVAPKAAAASVAVATLGDLSYIHLLSSGFCFSIPPPRFGADRWLLWYIGVKAKGTSPTRGEL